jgi:iduronate 2-sulfatase
MSKVCKVGSKVLGLCLMVAMSMNMAAHSTFAQKAKPAIKNVLMIVSDDLKASVLGCYGDKFCKTPNIDKLAARGMVFERAYCQGTSCQPSRLSFMHGRYQLGGKKNQKQVAKPLNMGEHFIKNGMFSARVGKIYHMRVPGDIIAGTDGGDIASTWTQRFNSQGKEAHTPGAYACLNLNIFTDALENRQSTRMPHRMFVTVKYKGDGSDQPDHKTATKTIELLQKHKDKPFFLAAGFVRPHYPMVAPTQYFEPYPWEKMLLPHVPANDLKDIPKSGKAGTSSITNPIGKYPDNQKRMWAGYYATVAFMDEQVGRILDELDRLGLTDSTAVVFMSDHGYHLGEHTFWQKSNLHEEVVRVPLIVAVPGMDAGTSKSIVELVDVYPTLAQLVGLSVPKSAQGVSLVPVLKDPNATVKEAALAFNRGHGWRGEKFAYMRYTDKSEELYDMEADPKQFTNLAGKPKYADVLRKMRTGLEKKLKTIGKGR